MEAPTPLGVPVEITSPGSRLKAVERCSTSVKQSKIRCWVLLDCRGSPFTQVRRSRLCGSGISSGVTMAGPSGQWVSKDFPMVKVGTRSCQSRTETSLQIV
jgi:hypothetical protein